MPPPPFDFEVPLLCRHFLRTYSPDLYISILTSALLTAHVIHPRSTLNSPSLSTRAGEHSSMPLPSLQPKNSRPAPLNPPRTILRRIRFPYPHPRPLPQYLSSG